MKKRYQKCTIKYWTELGFSLEEAKIKCADYNKLNNRHYPEYWIHRGYSIKESILKSKQSSKRNKEYWMLQGYSEDDAVLCAKYYNPTHIKYWIVRGYTKKDYEDYVHTHFPKYAEYWIKKGYSLVDAQNKANEINMRSSRCRKEYWIFKGYSEEDAIQKANECTTKNINKMQSNISNINRPLCKEYWMNKGFTEEESIEKAKEYNRNKTKDIPFEVRSKASKKAAKKITENQRKEINAKLSNKMKNKDKSFSPCFKEYWIKRGYSEKDAKIKSQEVKCSSNNGSYRASKIEKIFFDEFEQATNIQITRQKWVTIDKKFYCQDGRYENIVFEFNGTNYHLDPRVHTQGDTDPHGRTYEFVHTRDSNRIEKFKTKGYNVIVIWERDFKQNKDVLFNQLKNVLCDFKCGSSKYWDSLMIESVSST